MASLKRQLLLLLPSRVELLLHSDERLAVPALKKLAYAASSSMSCIIMRTLMDRSDRPSALLAVGEDGTVWPLRSPLRKDKRRKSLVLGSTHELEAWSMCSRRPHTRSREREGGDSCFNTLWSDFSYKSAKNLLNRLVGALRCERAPSEPLRAADARVVNDGIDARHIDVELGHELGHEIGARPLT